MGKWQDSFSSSMIEKMINDCESAVNCSNSPFDAWQAEFVEGIRDQYEGNGERLTAKQAEKLEEAWDKI